MRVVAIASVKNEIDIIEAFVRHTLALVDQLVILDNGSTDGTLDVLHNLLKEGAHLDIIEDPSLGKYQSRRMTNLMHEYGVVRYKADWILPLDGDEFLGVPEGGCLIPEDASQELPLSLPWRVYMPHPDDDPDELNPVLRIHHYVSLDVWEIPKVVVPRQLAALADSTLGHGNHELLIHGQPHRTTCHGTAYLAHFPIRSPGQYLSKVIVTSLQYMAMADNTSVYYGQHYRDTYERAKHDPYEFMKNFTVESSRNYIPSSKANSKIIEDPIFYRGSSLTCTPVVNDNVRGWQAILLFAEELARRYAVLSSSLTETGCSNLARESQLVHLLRSTLKQVGRQYEQSWTWRIGSLVVRPASWLKQKWFSCPVSSSPKL